MWRRGGTNGGGGLSAQLVADARSSPRPHPSTSDEGSSVEATAKLVITVIVKHTVLCFMLSFLSTMMKRRLSQKTPFIFSRGHSSFFYFQTIPFSSAFLLSSVGFLSRCYLHTSAVLTQTVCTGPECAPTSLSLTS